MVSGPITSTYKFIIMSKSFFFNIMFLAFCLYLTVSVEIDRKHRERNGYDTQEMSPGHKPNNGHCCYVEHPR